MATPTTSVNQHTPCICSRLFDSYLVPGHSCLILTTAVVFTTCIPSRCTLVLCPLAAVDPLVTHHARIAYTTTLSPSVACGLLVRPCCRALLHPCFYSTRPLPLTTVPLLPVSYFIELPFSKFALNSSSVSHYFILLLSSLPLVVLH